MTKTERWPRLSKLPGRRRPGVCQACDTEIPQDRRTIWRECDDSDRPEATIVVLCRACADRLIEPHPRLYKQVLTGEPLPGGMTVCLDCKYRSGLACQCPMARLNGGEGITFDPPPNRVHLCRSPRSLSGWYWLGPEITHCSGKEVHGATVHG